MFNNLVEKKIDSSTIFQGKVLTLKNDHVLLPNDAIASREYILHPGAAAVIPYQKNGNIFLVKQFRYPIQQITLEIPAGKLDPTDKTPLSCAIRELKEETGYTAGKITKLTTIATSVGFSNEYIHIFLAENLITGKQALDSDEFLNVVSIPLKKAVELINNGQIFDAKSVIGIFFLKNLLESRGGCF